MAVSPALRDIERALERAFQAQREVDGIRTDKWNERWARFRVREDSFGQSFAEVSISRLAEVMESELS